jgi:RND superfamily putative drug exporter
MDAFSGFVLRHKTLVVVVWLLATAAGLLATLGIGDRLSSALDQPGQPAQVANDAIVRTYGTGGEDAALVPVITLPAGRTVDDPAAQRSIRAAFHAAARQLDARIVSYADTGDPRLVGRAGRTTFGLVFPPAVGGGFDPPDRSAAVAAAMRAELPPGAALRVTGMTPLELGAGADGGGAGLLLEVLIGGLGALVVLAVVFGSLLAVIPLLIAAVSILTSFLIISGLAVVSDVSVIVQYVVALIGLGVAIDYSLLLITRWREERARGLTGDAAVRRAMATAGRSVVFSGMAVAIGLIAMVALPIPFLRSVAYGGIVIPLASVLVVLTLLPVLLAAAGRRLDWPRPRRTAAPGRGWTTWARGVIRHRWAAALTSAGLLLALGGAALGLHLGEAESASLAGSGPAYEGAVALDRAGIPSGVLTSFDVLLPAGTDPTATATRLAALDGVRTAVAPPDAGWRRGGTALVTVIPVDEGGTDAGKATVRRVRAAVPAGARVGGTTAKDIDFIDAVYGVFPLMLGLIALLTFVVLARAFRSLLLPLKAVLLNLLSLGAILGAMVLVWQDGYGSRQIWDIEPTGSIATFIPLMVFAFLYGLSMDYEVFILTRIREEYDRTGSTRVAVAEGIGRTGRLVTSAALILFLSFASLAAAPGTELKVFATGLGLGVLLDATVIRALLVPALVAILGRWNWWLPRWAARLLRIPPSSPHPEPEPLAEPASARS